MEADLLLLDYCQNFYIYQLLPFINLVLKNKQVVQHGLQCQFISAAYIASKISIWLK